MGSSIYFLMIEKDKTAKQKEERFFEWFYLAREFTSKRSSHFYLDTAFRPS
ncbi:hypothetical protein [Priestia aryabhattai]